MGRGRRRCSRETPVEDVFRCWWSPQVDAALRKWSLQCRAAGHDVETPCDDRGVVEVTVRWRPGWVIPIPRVVMENLVELDEFRREPTAVGHRPPLPEGPGDE